MERFSTKHLGLGFAVLAMVLAGCSGGGNGNGGQTTALEDGNGEATETTVPEEETEMTTTMDDESTETTTTSDSTETTTTEEDDSSGPVDTAQHAAGLRDAGSYTLELTTYSVTAQGGNITDVGSATITQKRIVETNERLMIFSNGDSIYKPPNADTAYMRVGGNVQEVPPDRSYLFNYTALTSSAGEPGLLDAFANMTEPVDGSTSMGPADKYVIDSVTQVPESQLPSSEYGEVVDIEYVLWVDRETGVVAKLTTSLTVRQEDGEEYTFESGFEVRNLGSTTIEEPDWVPDN